MKGNLMYWNNRLLISKKSKSEKLNLFYEIQLGVNKTKLKSKQHYY